MRKKIKTQQGFTLIEMLACVIILLLISVVCSTGLNLAVQSYHTSVYESDSQMLESTLDMYLADMLRHATSVVTETNGEEVLYFTNSSYQIYEGTIEVPLSGEENSGMFVVYKDRDIEPTLMVSANVYAGSLYIEDFTLKYDEATQMFTGVYVIKSTILSDVARECEFAYRAVSEN